MSRGKLPSEKHLSIDGTIPYKVLDDVPGGGNLGRAEFRFCPLWTRGGRMRELLIYPLQQRSKVYYRLDLTDCGKVTIFTFESYGDRERPRPWRMGWCKEHKTVSYEVYVPDCTDHLSFSPHFGNTVSICFESSS